MLFSEFFLRLNAYFYDVSISYQARRGGTDEPFAWDSREFLRNLCIGKVPNLGSMSPSSVGLLIILMLVMTLTYFFLQEVAFRVDYAVPSIGREFGSVFIGDKNVAMLVVSKGWAKVSSLFILI